MTRWFLLSALLVTACSSSTADDGEGAGGATSSSSTGSTSDSTSSTGGAAGCVEGPAIPDNPACEACQNENCCVTAKNCVDNAECLAVEACVAEAHSTSSCYSQHPDGTWDWSGLDTCRVNHCATECGHGPGACGNIIPTPASCTDEVNAACCDVTTACGNNDACLALIYQCLDEQNCGAPACEKACEDAYPEGKADFLALVDCWSNVPCL